MAGCTQFEILKTFSRAWDRAQRFALAPLLRSTENLRTSRSLELTQHALTRVVRWRRRVLLDLYYAGWDPMFYATSKKRTYLLNCPPVCVWTGGTEHRQACNYYQICPWCWARHYVQGLYFRLEFSLLGAHRGEPLPRRVLAGHEPLAGRCELVDYQTTYNFRAGPPVYNPHRLDVVREFTERQTRHMRRQLPNLGAFNMWTVEPTYTAEGEMLAWNVKERVVALVEPDQPVPEPAHGSRYLTRSRVEHREQHITRSLLAVVAGRTCLFPAKLFTAEMVDVAELLSYDRPPDVRGRFQRRRLVSAYYGCFRHAAFSRFLAGKRGTPRALTPA